MLSSVRKHTSLRHTVTPYAIAVLATAAVVVICFAASGAMEPYGLFYLLSLLAVTLAGVAGGWKPALLATGLAALAGACCFIERSSSYFYFGRDYLWLLQFIVIGVAAGWLCEWAHRNRRRLLTQQQVLQAANDRLFHVVRTAPVAVAVFDREMRYLAASHRWLSDFGLEHRELIGQCHYTVFPDIPERWRIAHQRGLAGESLRADEDRFDRSDGRCQWVRWELQPWYTEGGEVGGIIIVSEDITKRKEAEERLQASERRYRSLITALSEMVWRTGPHGETVEASERWTELTGQKPEESAGLGWLNALHPKDRAATLERRQRSLATGQPFEVAARVRRPDGTYWHMLARGAPVRDDSGRITEWIGVVLDVTQVREAEQQLRKTNRLLQTISRVQAEFLVQGDTRHVFELMLSALLEVSESEYGFIGEVLHQPDGQPYLKTHAISDIAWNEQTRAVHQKYAPNLEFYNLKTLFGAVMTTAAPVIANDPATDPRRGGLPPGHPPLRAFLGLPIFHGGQLIGMVGVANRVGGYDEAIAQELLPLLNTCGNLIAANRVEQARKQAEQRLQASQHMLQTVLDNIPQGVFWKDLQSRYLGCNAVVARAFGFRSAEEMLGKTDREFPCLSKEQADFFLRKDQEVIASGQPILGIVEQATLADNSTIWMETNKIPLRDAQGHIIGVLGSWQDITERKRLEEQLRQSQKMEAIGQLAGGVAHDFNNLLTVITGYADLLLSRVPADDPMRHDLEQIRSAGERAASLTSQLLAFSRKQVMQPKILDLNAVVTDAEKMLRRVIGEHIVLSVRCASALPRIKADPTQIGQVLLNLAVNARDAMPQGGNLIIETSTVELDQDYTVVYPDVKPGRYVMMAVSDTGCGMTPEVRARIFEPFFTTKGPGRGTGLGLAVVHGIVKQTGGHIEVYSEPGHGTTFKVYLPCVNAEASLSIGNSQPRSVKYGTETVLLVEDEEGVRRLAEITLRSHGYTVLTAANAKEALEHVATHRDRIDLLVTDVVMPGMSGPQLVEALQTQHPTLKVLVVSGYTQEAMLQHGIQEGEVAFLQKPYGPTVLANTVREVLDSQR